MRNLATIQTVKTVEPIEGKDKIGLATFESVGYKVIVSKQDVKPNDKVVYFEVDSLLPGVPDFEFLRARCWSEKYNGHRIRAMKMGGIFSEGLALPLNHFRDLDSLFSRIINTGKCVDNFDVTEMLGVKKYDPEAFEEERLASRRASKRGPFMKFLFRFAFIRWIVNFVNSIFHPKQSKSWPRFLSKTDETRVQNLTYVFERFQGEDVYVSEKLDGQSATYAIHDKKFIVCSRNFALKRDESKYWQLADKYKLEEKLRLAVKDYGFDIAIQMESCGPAIQGNKYGFKEGQGFVFNVFNIKEKKYFGYNELLDFCIKYDLTHVPMLEVRKFDWKNVDELLKYADGYSIFGTKVLREGVVVRTVKYRAPETKMANMWSLKAISPSFVIKNQDNDYSTGK
jgi:hypothetical protein